MRRNPKRKRSAEDLAPSADDFKRKAVNRAIFKKTIQEPITLWPGAASLVSLFYMLLFDASIAPLLICLSSGLISACSWIANFFIRGETLIDEHVEQLVQQRTQSTLAQVQSLQEDFHTAGFNEGVRAAQELTEAYKNIRGFLETKAYKEEDLSAHRFLILAEDVYLEGVAVLKRALNIFQAVRDIDGQKLEDELWEFRRQLELLTTGAAEADQAEIERLERQIRRHKERLQRYNARVNSLRELLAKCEELEGALEVAYLDIAELVDSEIERFQIRADTVAELERSIEIAHSLNESLGQMTYLTTPEGEEEYPRAIRNTEARRE